MKLTHSLEVAPGLGFSVYADPDEPVIVTTTDSLVQSMTLAETVRFTQIASTAVQSPLTIMNEIAALPVDQQDSGAVWLLRQMGGRPELTTALVSILTYALYDAAALHPTDPMIRAIQET